MYKSIQKTIENFFSKNDVPIGTRYIKTSFSRSLNKYIIELSTTSSENIQVIENMLKLDSKNALLKINVVETQTADMGDVISMVNERLMSSPAFSPFARGAEVKIEDNCIDIFLSSDMACDCARLFGIPEDIEKSVRARCGVDMRVRNIGVSKHKTEDKPLPERELKRRTINLQMFAQDPVTRKEENKPEQPCAEPKAPRRPRRNSKSVFGKRIDGEISKMIDVHIGDEAVIEGKLLSTEYLTSKDGKWNIIKFNITDYTDTMPCIIITRADVAAMKGMLKKGERFRVKGKAESDSRTNARNFRAEAIETAESQKRMDTAEKKRVELHLHTKMSTEDGMTYADDYIARAAEWGHKAIAITDHGVVQAFPMAASAAKWRGIHLIYGMEAYMTDDSAQVYYGDEHGFDGEYVVFDLETTGLSKEKCEIIEIGAVKISGKTIIDRFSTFVKPSVSIPADIVTLTGITDEMVADAPHISEALPKFAEFAGDACLVAHNAPFDVGFVREKGAPLGIKFNNDVLDTVVMSRILLDLKKNSLDVVAKHFGIPLKHHRAVNDAEATAEILLRLFKIMQDNGNSGISDINGYKVSEKNKTTYHTIILCKNKKGLVNLYKLVSAGHLKYFYRKPRIPKSLIEQHREGLIIGSACEQGELFRAILKGADEKKIEKIASFYDYLEVQPNGNNEFLIRSGDVADEEGLRDIVRKICALGEKLGKPVVATTDSHFLDPEDEYLRRIIMHGKKFADADNQAPLYFKTTDEMLEEFAYLGEEKAMEIVVDNPNAIADMTEPIKLFQSETAMPEIPDSDKIITDIAYKRMYARYGDPLPDIVKERLERELEPIIKHGFSVLYLLAQRLVSKSESDGYLVGSRGSVGSSLAAFALGITEVNALQPHYICPNCKHSDFDVDTVKYDCGIDMPEKRCPVCGEMYDRDGYTIPFEVFLGIDADKVPDIDLNFSGDYQSKAHDYVEEMFGSDNVFRAGTISGIKSKTAYGYVKKYMEDKGIECSEAEIERLSAGIEGVKKTTGQHPGGMVIVPKTREVYEFTPIQRPADSPDAHSTTTHFDFNSMHDVLIKLDILGHDNPTAIRMLEDITGMNMLKVPLDDEDTMKLFVGLEPLGITPEQIGGISIGTLGIPEFGTAFTRQMLKETQPKTMSELVRISGLSHGTNVWTGNAQELIKSGTTNLAGAICTRDDIMRELSIHGMDKREAFFIMESVRKGKWAKGADGNQPKQEEAIRAVGVPEWFIESCRKIEYMFPKAHAVAYVVMAFRIAYCKVHYPLAFYATYFSLKADTFDSTCFMGGTDGMKRHMDEILAKGKGMSATEKELVGLLEVGIEMYARGFSFLPISLEKSKDTKFTVEGNSIRMPFIAIPKLGEKAATSLMQAVKEGFTTVEELKTKAKLNTSVMDVMRKMGCFEGIPESSQLSIFDI